jgi:hypothetical protein
VPRGKADREAGKHFFFEKKKQKTFDYFGFGFPGETEAKSQSFLVLFFKKEPLSAACLGPALVLPLAAHHGPRRPKNLDSCRVVFKITPRLIYLRKLRVCHL